MNYETATNFELNKRLAELLGMQIADVFDSPFNYATSQKDAITRKAEYESRYPNTVWARKDGEPWEQFVFTHDWCQTMPLAVEHKLSMESRCSLPKLGWMVSHTDGHYSASKSDLLREIVIFLIKVLENE